jgi:outer membrane protein assembly factor BamE (lipoprotein component of BamABCDE complex)
MRRCLAAPFLIVSIAVSMGCTKPDLDVSKVRVGMTKKEVLERVGAPSRTAVVNDTEVYEYEAYDHYGAIKINNRSQFIRFVGGKVESFGTLEALKAGGPAHHSMEAMSKSSPEVGGETVSSRAAPPGSTAFDLRTELEKLGRLKKDGLISEAEFSELRQKVLDKAKAL